jgi:sugar transferase (PEP-CTERM/EpsH1 system associated)
MIAPPLIAHVIHRLDFGGLENGLVNLVNGMPAERFRHAIVCLAGFNQVFRDRIQRSDVEVISLGKRPGKDLGAYARMWGVLRRLAPSVVHTRNLGTVDMQWIAASAGVPHRVHGEHGWEAADPCGRNPKALRIRRACRPVIHLYVPMSKDIAHWLEKEVHVNPSRIRQLYSGVDVHRFTPAAEANLFDRSAFTIGNVGRLDPVKNQESLLQAFAALSGRFPNLRLAIVGEGPLRSSLEAAASALGVADRVSFTGARNDTPELMRTFDLFVLPSINEGISNTILEAMATGLPVVAARVGGNPELIADGITGRLYDQADPAALERALVPYLTDPAECREHGAAGRVRVMQNFSLDAMVQRYLDVYDELLLH